MRTVRHFAQEVAKGAHRSRKPQFLLKTKGARRFREEPCEPLRPPFSRALCAHSVTTLPCGPR